MPESPDVSSALKVTLALLNKGDFDYAIIGGLAVVLNGYDRYTQDVDALVWDLDERLEELRSLLIEKDFRPPTDEDMRRARSTRLLHTVWRNEVQVDFMLGLVPFERDALDHAVTVLITDNVSAKVATPEDLIIMKLIASRPQDIADVIALRELHPGVNVERIRAIVLDYAAALESVEIMTNLETWLKN